MYHGILSCPNFLAKPAYAISSHNCHRNVSLPSGASLWNGMFGRVEGQYTTLTVLFRSVSLKRFPFLNHIQVTSCEISPVCCLKYPYSYFILFLFSSLYCFLLDLVMPLLLQVAVISLSRFFLCIFESSSIDASTQSSMISKSFSSFCFYVRSLTLNTLNQICELRASAAEYIIDITCIREYRYYHCELEIKHHFTSKA